MITLGSLLLRNYNLDPSRLGSIPAGVDVMRKRLKKLLSYTLHLLVCGRVRKAWQVVQGGRDRALAFLRSRSGATARLLRYPMPLSAPWRRDSLDIGRPGGIGDVLMCTPALRELKRKNPMSYVRFYSNYAALV